MRRLLLLATFGSSLFAMDPERGKQVLRDQNCLSCHNVRGVGAVTAPDLAGRLVDHYTPAALASLLWNHLPEMWAALSREGITRDQATRPRPTERDSEDLFAYLYSTHFLNQVGNELRGWHAFEQRGCMACHSAGPGLPVEKWNGIPDAFALIQRMWNHAPQMRRSRDQNGVVFERLSSRDLADITAFATRGRIAAAQPATLPESKAGEVTFKSNCGGCHPAMVDLTKRLQDRTPAEVAAGLWNHATRMQTVPLAAPNDMRNLVGYVWNLQFQTQGNPVRGAKVFRDKRCVGCHQTMNRGERVFTAYTMIAQWWQHGPLMQADLDKHSPRWPYLSAEDVDDLIAYLNRKP